MVLLLPACSQTTTLPVSRNFTEEFVYDEAPFPECHASSIAETPQGLVVVWFGGTKEKNKDVEIWMSNKRNGKWSELRAIADGVQPDGKRHPCWNPVLFQVPGGDLLLFYKVGPSPSTWWGEMKHSSDGGETWSAAKKLEGGIGPVKNKPELLGESTLLCPSSTEHDGWRVHFETTSDWGETWEISEPINDGKTFNAIQPSILKHGGEKLQILARSKEGVLLSSWSDDLGKTWTDLEPSGLPNPNSGTDALTLKDGRHLLVYNHTTTPKGKWGGKRSPLNVAISEDGKQWSAVAVLEHEPGEYSYPAVIQAQDGKVHVSYTWKRKKVKHVVLDPANFDPKPILGGKWP